MNYEELINRAEKEFDSFSLVWRDGFKFNKSAKNIQNELSRYLIKELRTSEWPGTKIFKALVLYPLNLDCMVSIEASKHPPKWLGHSLIIIVDE
jgi:hypothetical protein